MATERHKKSCGRGDLAIRPRWDRFFQPLCGFHCEYVYRVRPASGLLVVALCPLHFSFVDQFGPICRTWSNTCAMPSRSRAKRCWTFEWPPGERRDWRAAPKHCCWTTSQNCFRISINTFSSELVLTTRVYYLIIRSWLRHSGTSG